MTRLARWLQSHGRALLAASLRPRALTTLIAGGAARGIGLADRLLGSPFAPEQDAQRQKRNARVKPQRGVANIPVRARPFPLW
jgi:hypothetical protein